MQKWSKEFVSTYVLQCIFLSQRLRPGIPSLCYHNYTVTYRRTVEAVKQKTSERLHLPYSYVFSFKLSWAIFRVGNWLFSTFLLPGLMVMYREGCATTVTLLKLPWSISHHWSRECFKSSLHVYLALSPTALKPPLNKQNITAWSFKAPPLPPWQYFQFNP